MLAKTNGAGDWRAVSTLCPRYQLPCRHTGTVRHQGDARPIAVGAWRSARQWHTAEAHGGDIAIFRIARYQFGFSTSASISTKVKPRARWPAQFRRDARLRRPEWLGFAAGVNDLFQPQLLIDIRRHDFSTPNNEQTMLSATIDSKWWWCSAPFFTR